MGIGALVSSTQSSGLQLHVKSFACTPDSGGQLRRACTTRGMHTCSFDVDTIQDEVWALATAERHSLLTTTWVLWQSTFLILHGVVNMALYQHPTADVLSKLLQRCCLGCGQTHRHTPTWNGHHSDVDERSHFRVGIILPTVYATILMLEHI